MEQANLPNKDHSIQDVLSLHKMVAYESKHRYVQISRKNDLFDIRNGKLIFYLLILGIIIYLGVIGYHIKALKGIAIISIGLFFVLFPKSNIGAKSILISKNGVELNNFFSRKSIKADEISTIEVDYENDHLSGVVGIINIITHKNNKIELFKLSGDDKAILHEDLIFISNYIADKLYEFES